jgi:hypothetical protein
MQLGVVRNIAGEGYYVQNGTSPITISNDIRYPYSSWISQIDDGDSGSPTFLPTGLTTATGTPLTILLGVQYSITNSSSLSSIISEINQAMNAMKDPSDTTTYALDVISTSQPAWWNSFTTY